MASTSNCKEMSEADIQHEIDEVNALFEDDPSWLVELELNNTKDKSLTDSQTFLDTSNDEFDSNCGSTWVFPINMEKRDYQYNISRSTLFNNTLVILPTGLGKTFIASVTIYNFYRWYPKSKIIFMAPTRPLVNQQISACYDIVGIQKSDTAEMTGKIVKSKRKELWDSKRVFFATPQVVCSDLEEGIFPSAQIKLLVFDEAHRAQKNYSYCKVITEILKVQNKFRVLAMTATAGKSSDVIQIIQKLLISKIEYRSEESIDVRAYTHKKSIETVSVQLTDELQEIYNHFLKVVDPIVKELREGGYIRGFSASKGQLLFEQQKIRENTGIPANEKGAIMNLFSTAISFYHSLEILQCHSVYLFLKSLRDDSIKTSYKFFINRDLHLLHYVKSLDEKYEPNSPFQVNINPLPNGEVPSIVNQNIDFGHPKFDILKNKLLEYFDNDGSKAIIFCEYRDTTVLISKMLQQLKPKVLARTLIGQGKSITQKDQMRIMKEFREGEINTLICTSVGEEGLDIGAVDLIICFDINSKNATRFVQRIGRTARKRSGKVIVLATEGRELQMIKNLIYNKDSINKSISRNKDISKYFYNAPRLVPANFQPQCIETKFVIAEEAAQEEDNGKSKKKKNQPKKATKRALKAKATITKHFKPQEKEDDDVNMEVDADPIIETIEPPKKFMNEHDIQQYTQDYVNSVYKFIKENELEDNVFLKDIVECRAKEGVESIRHLASLLMNPSKLDHDIEMNFDTVDELNLSFVEEDIIMPMDEAAFSETSRYGIQFSNNLKNSSSFIPCKTIFNESMELIHPQKIDEISEAQFNSPLLTQFQKQQKRISSSTPVRKLTSSLRVNDLLLSQVESKTQYEPDKNVTNDQQCEKFPFLGINSISDIFEGCDTRVCESNCYSPQETYEAKSIERLEREVVPICENERDCLSQESFENKSIEELEQEVLSICENERDCSSQESFVNKSIEELEQEVLSICAEDDTKKSIEQLEKEISQCHLDDEIEGSERHLFTKFNLDDIEDLFDHDENNDAASNSSGKTEIYDFEAEMSKVDSHKENEIISDSTVESQSPPRPPVVAKLLAAIKSNNFYANQGILKEQNLNVTIQPSTSKVNIESFDSSPEKIIPKRKNPRILTQSPVSSHQPQIDNDSDDEFISPVRMVRKKPTMRKKKKKLHNSFLQTQAGVSDIEDASSDENDEHEMTTLGGFIHNETLHTQLESSSMYAKYVQSLQSPNAAINRNVHNRQLPPMSFSQIFSQIPQEDDENDDDSDLDSFINDSNVEDGTASEIDELELAEQILKEKRRNKRKMKESKEAKCSKKRKVIKDDSSSEDEELKKLRRELMM